MENKSGRRISLNFFDIIIIVVVIALAAGFIWIKAGRGQEGGAGGNTTVQYDIEITNLTADTQNLIAEGDAIIDKVRKQHMEKVVSFEVYPMKKDAVNLETGDTVYTEVPGLYAAKITLEAECSDTGSALVTGGGFEVRTGTEVSILGPGYGGGGYVIDVVRGEENE